MRGLTLPINLTVITGVVVMVLIAIVLFFVTSAGPGFEPHLAFNEICQQLDCGTPSGICLEVYGQTPGHDTAFYDRFFAACEAMGRGKKSDHLSCFEACGNCVRLTDAQKTYIFGGSGQPAIQPDLNGILSRCAGASRVP